MVDEYLDKEANRKVTDYFKTDKRYMSFTFLDEPVKFYELFEDEEFDVIQIHDMLPSFTENKITGITGFAGIGYWFCNSFMLEASQAAPDGRPSFYNGNMLVWGYERFNADGERYLDVLPNDQNRSF